MNELNKAPFKKYVIYILGLSISGILVFQNCAKIDFAGGGPGQDQTVAGQAQNADSDQDGLPDNVESQIGTDPTDKDTDNDGLMDGAEVTQHSTDPLNPDTDHGGVNDGDEIKNGTNPLDGRDDQTNPHPGDKDSDQDGLKDTEESQLGTDPRNPDSDGDHLKDGAEVHTYHTNPLDPDTDDGGVNDGVEVFEGKNPLDPADDKTQTCELRKKPHPIQFPCPSHNSKCNNGGGNGSEGCSASENGNNDE